MKNYVTLPHQIDYLDSTAMATLTFTINVPDNKAIDLAALKMQVEAFVNAVVSVPTILKKDEKEDLHVFDCFSGDYGGDKDAHEIEEELRSCRVFIRKVEAI